MAKDKSNSAAADMMAFIRFPGVDHITGTIMEYNEGGVHFQSRKLGSQTKLHQFFPASKIVLLMGSKGSAECDLWYMRDDMTPFSKGNRKRGVPITPPTVYGEHMVKSNSSDFPVILLGTKFLTVTGEIKSEGGSGRGRKPKADKKSSKK